MGRATRAPKLQDSKQNGPNLEKSRKGRKRVAVHGVDGHKKRSKESILLPVPSLAAYEGVVLTVGQGDTGQLGLGPDVMQKLRPAAVSLPEPVADIAAGGVHTVCLTKSGHVYTFGCNDECALGRVTENEDEQMVPGKVDLLEKIAQISAGDSHSVALSGSGNVYIWGNFRNSEGQMGLTVNQTDPQRQKEPQRTPMQILQGVQVVQVASGNDHIVFLSADGVPYSCGNGEQGQLGRIAPHKVQTGGRNGPGLLLNPQPIIVHKSNKVVKFDKIWTGAYSSFLRSSSGEIYGFGLNNCCQLGFHDEHIRYTPQQIPSFSGRKWSVISGGEHHTLGLDESGSVYCLGRKDDGRLGLGEGCVQQSKPAHISSLSEKCVHVDCGASVSYAVSEQGVIYSWGFGENGQLGHGNEEDVLNPKPVLAKSLSEMITRKVCGGGQHSVILAH